MLEYHNMKISLQKVKNWFEQVFAIKKNKNTLPWTYVINDLNGEEIVGNFYEKECSNKKSNTEKKR